MSASDESKFEHARRIQFAFTDEQEQFRTAIRRFLHDKSSPTEVRRVRGELVVTRPSASGTGPDNAAAK